MNRFYKTDRVRSTTRIRVDHVDELCEIEC